MTKVSKKAGDLHTTINKEMILSLRKMISILTKGSKNTDDIMQEVLIKVHKKGSDVDPAKFISWLYQVSRTTTIDYYRKNKNFALLEDHHLDTNLLNQDEDHSSAERLAQCVRPLLKNLKNEDQRILTAIELEGVQQNEFAEQEGLKYSSLKSKVQRARQKLKDEILTCCQVELDSRKRPIDLKSNKKQSCC